MQKRIAVQGESPKVQRLEQDSEPLISIITPSFNQAQFLEATIRSVLDQDYSRIEYIVIDGCSTDGSVEIIRRHEHQLAYWVSEPDHGQSHALEKGFARANGRILGWLNSDDLFVPSALAAVATIARQHPGSIIAGSVVEFSEGNTAETVLLQRGWALNNLVKWWEEQFVFRQQGFFFPRSAYLEVGGIDERLHFSFDYDLICRLVQQCPVVYVDSVLAKYRFHEESKTCSQTEEFYLESRAVSHRYWHLVESVDVNACNRYVAQRLVRQAGKRMLQGSFGRSGQILKQAMQINAKAALGSVPGEVLRWVKK